VQLLYRIDVSEAKLKYILQAHPNEDAGKLIAAVVIERLAATKKARRNVLYSKRGRFNRSRRKIIIKLQIS